MKLIENLKNKFKKNKKSNNKKIQEKPKAWLKILHVICYILSIIFIIICLYGCFNPVKNEDNKNNTNTNKLVPPNVMEVKEVKKENYYNQSGTSLTLYATEFYNYYVFKLFDDYFDFSSIKNISLSGTIYYYNTGNYTTQSHSFSYMHGRYYNNRDEFAYYFDNNSTLGSPYLSYFNLICVDTSGNYSKLLYTYNSNNNTYFSKIIFSNLPSDLKTSIIDYLDNGYIGGGSGYSEEDLENSYNNGYNEGYNVAYNKVTNEDIEYIHFSNYFDWRILLTNAYQINTGLFYLPYNNGDNQPLFTGLTFSSNGKTYNQIRLNCVFLDTSTKVVYKDYDSNGLVTNYGKTISDIFSVNPTGRNVSGLVAVTYEYVDSQDSNNNYSDVVFTCYDYNATGIDESTSHINNYIDYNVPKWSNDAYKTLVVIEDSGQVANPIYTDVSLLTLLDSNSSVSLSNYNDYLDVFSLLAMGFTSLTSLFNMALLPNITIGMLLFMPLLVVMFITIIKLIKK